MFPPAFDFSGLLSGLSQVPDAGLTSAEMLRRLWSWEEGRLRSVAQVWVMAGLLKVVSWTQNADGPYALHIDRTPLEHPEDQLYIPFPWLNRRSAPSVQQAINIVRRVRVTHYDPEK